jgi:N-acetyl-alpha-D-glucosaminyl L-malate synthase BshA
VEDVIHVFEIVRKEVNSKLLMIGDGPERQHAEELSKQLGLYNEVRFLGKQEQMDEILSIADLFILPSQYESFGLAALEAMACGVPVISTNAGGLGEININGETGYLSDVGDVTSMAENAIKILKNDDTLKHFKENAIAHAATFDKSKIVPMYEHLYEEVISKYCRKQNCLTNTVAK